MKIKILSWNVRGLNDPDKRTVVKGLLNRWKCSVVCLQETKLRVVDERVVRSLWGRGRWVKWECLRADGTAGGILLMWDSRLLTCLDHAVGNHSISCLFKNEEDGNTWAFAGVYGPHLRSDRRELWEELSGIRSVWGTPWVCGGDFNVVRYSYERVGGKSPVSAMRDFSEYITEEELVDLPLEGDCFTWSNGTALSRLDRFLISSDWEGEHMDIRQYCLPRVVSDHKPVFLVGGGMNRGPTPFRFENMWLQVEGFKDLVRKWWEGYVVHGSPSYRLARKLRWLKEDLKRWNREIFGRIEIRLANLSEELQGLESKEHLPGLSDEEKDRRADLKTEIGRLLLAEETSWRQKSRATWLAEGDRNTAFFHRTANAHRRFNYIAKIKVDGVVHEGQDAVATGIVGFYEKLYNEPEQWRPRVDGLWLPSLNLEEVDRLTRPFGEEEVVEVLREMRGDKAPGPDGFSIAFLQHCWPVVKDDIMAVLEHVHAVGDFEKSLNATFIVLIPKKNGALDIGDYRPISLIGCIYKILAKVLARRMAKVMDRLISENQNAFVGGRQILDASLVANECVDGRLRSKEPGILCKLDIEKAYDHVSWDFMLYLLKRMGFGEKWCSWIKCCISSTKFSVLVNGSAQGFFGGSRGLRQGDPLSPFLFIIVMDVLSRFISRAVSVGRLSGFRVGEGRRGETVSHLLFADDTLIFCKDEVRELACLKDILLCFQAVSGLKINMEKSELIPVGDGIDLRRLTDVLGCKAGSLPSTYLGLPLGSPYKSKAAWGVVVERVERRLASWKGIYLSKGGKLTLIKSTLSSMPTYFLSLFTMPKSIAQRIERLMRVFLWKGLMNDKGIHLVAWRTLCLPKKGGGLGIRDLGVFNRALLGKWIWRFAQGQDKLWCRVIKCKYDTLRGDWRTKDIVHSHGSSLWKGIMRVWRDLYTHVSYQLGNGSKIRFWHDVWCGQMSFRDKFPELFALATYQEASVEECWSPSLVGGSWLPLFRRGAQDWELEAFVELFSALQEACPASQEVDKWRWKRQGKGRFTVSSFYHDLTGMGDPMFPWKGIWVSKVPSKVCFFGWTAARGAILTIDNLRRRKIVVTEWCYMCKRSAESTDHLLLHCQMASELWSLVFSTFGVRWVMPGTVKDLFACWSQVGWRGRRRKAWRVAPLCLFWGIWRERNLRAFEDVENSLIFLKTSFLSSLFLWIRRVLPHSPLSLADFLGELRPPVV